MTAQEAHALVEKYNQQDEKNIAIILNKIYKKIETEATQGKTSVIASIDKIYCNKVWTALEKNGFAVQKSMDSFFEIFNESKLDSKKINIIIGW